MYFEMEYTPQQTVFLIDDLRKEILSYFRTTPHIGCVQCGKVIFWEPEQKVNSYVRMYNSRYWCSNCFRNETMNINCNIS